MKIAKINVILENLKAKKSLEEVDELNVQDVLCEINSLPRRICVCNICKWQNHRGKLPRKPHVTEAHKENKKDGEFLNKQGLLWCYINLMFTNHC